MTISMKNTAVLILLGLLNLQLVRAQITYPYAAAGPAGIYVMCGNQIPRGFSYHVFRSMRGSSQWEELRTLSFTSTFDEFYRDVEIANGHNNLYELPLEKYKGILWQMIMSTNDADSIPFYGPVPMYREALGITFYDMTAKPGNDYVYKVVKKMPGERDSESLTGAVQFPAPVADYKIRFYWQNPLESHVHLKFHVGQQNRIFTARAYRQYYLQSEFVPIQSPVGLSMSNDSLQAWVIDTTTVKKSIMQYFVVPYDVYGNPGKPSDTARVVNLIEKAESIIMGLHSTNIRDENSIILSWSCQVPEFLRSIDVYRSEEYDGDYRLIGSAAPTDTTFTDQQVNPITTYYYYLVINNAYGQSGKSARIAGMLEANRKAVPPYDLSAEALPGIVVLKWKKPSEDIRGYYVMRSDDGTGRFRQLDDLYTADSLLVTYVDTLKTINSNSLAYAVTSENTSYDISPMTAPVYVNPMLSVNLTTPVNLVTHYRDSLVLVTWDETSMLDPNVVGYRIMRKILTGDGADSTAWQPLVPDNDMVILNYFEDHSVQEGITYQYQVTAIGAGNLQSEGSIPSTVRIPLFRPVSLASIMAGRTSEGIQLSWEKTLQEQIITYKIYRLEEGSPPVMLAALPADQTGFTDRTAIKDVVYLYAVTCTNSKNIESRIDEWTGVR
jgi:fibronectin type 3 domain-containing protein